MRTRLTKTGPLGYCWAALSLLTQLGPVAEMWHVALNGGAYWTCQEGGCYQSWSNIWLVESSDAELSLEANSRHSRHFYIFRLLLWKLQAPDLVFPWVLSFLVLDSLTSEIINCVLFLTLISRIPISLSYPASWLLNLCHLLHSTDDLSSLEPSSVVLSTMSGNWNARSSS